MANNRMWLVNDRLKKAIFIAKYYPSEGWYRPADFEFPDFPEEDGSHSGPMDWTIRYEEEDGDRSWMHYEVLR